MATSAKYVYEPVKSHYFLHTTLYWFVQFMLAALIVFVYLQEISWTAVAIVTLAAVVAGVYGTLTHLPNLGVVIDDYAITGYSTLWRRTTTFPRRSIFLQESCRWSLWSRVKGYTYIYSLDGDRIVLSQFALGNTQVRAIQQQLRCPSDYP